MCSVIAIETSTPLGSVAVMRDGVITFEKSFTSERSHNSQLFSPLREALAACGKPLHGIVVGTGPASYTGVRIGIAAAQGIAVSRGVPVIGLPSILAIESNGTALALRSSFPREGASVAIPEVGPADYAVCGDARRGSYFVIEVHGTDWTGGFCMWDAEGLRNCHAKSPDDLPWYTFDPNPPLDLRGVRCVSPSASVLAQLAARFTEKEFEDFARMPLEPVYLSAPFVTMPRQH